ncbi:hypothetical protein BH10ACT2_BH10ACT2_27120 [soil metagenome]
MSNQVRFGPEAIAELSDAVRWYEQRRAGLGLALLAAVDAAIEPVSRWPRSGALMAGLEAVEVRRVPIASFPYHLAYLIVDEQIKVLAIAHDRRRPNYWSDRITR